MRTKRTKVTVESHQLLVVRRGGAPFIEDWCSLCGKQVQMITAAEAALMAGVSLRTICRRVEGGKLHFNETGDGLLFICLNSLAE
jgi:hypothetical protein